MFPDVLFLFFAVEAAEASLLYFHLYKLVLLCADIFVCSYVMHVTYTKIMSNVDLDEIKRIAIGELGMKYAKEGQVITYSGEGSDYVRQYGDIPE